MNQSLLPFRERISSRKLRVIAIELSDGCVNRVNNILTCFQFAFSVSRHPSLAERLSSGHRVGEVHGNAESVVCRDDIPTSLRVSQTRLQESNGLWPVAFVYWQ